MLRVGAQADYALMKLAKMCGAEFPLPRIVWRRIDMWMTLEQEMKLRKAERNRSDRLLLC